jgi:hypothetical protein
MVRLRTFVLEDLSQILGSAKRNVQAYYTRALLEKKFYDTDPWLQGHKTEPASTVSKKQWHGL